MSEYKDLGRKADDGLLDSSKSQKRAGRAVGDILKSKQAEDPLNPGPASLLLDQFGLGGKRGEGADSDGRDAGA